jgi:hypothetical protein
VFKITRSGSTNTAMTVNYSLCGTGSNGVDYVQLPGTVAIPAGHRSAEIVITPIDDTLAEGIETVVLVLEPVATAADSSPAYTVGWPNRAAAIIVDNDVPRPPSMRLHDSLFHLCAPATNGFIYRLELSTNLVNWIPVCTNTVLDQAVQFVDPDASNSSVRFYRWTPESSPGVE